MMSVSSIFEATEITTIRAILSNSSLLALLTDLRKQRKTQRVPVDACPPDASVVLTNR